MKVIHKDKLKVNRTATRKESQLCINELKALKTLHHPNIVQIKEVINDSNDENLYLVMQHMSGKNLQDKVDDCNAQGKYICRDFIWQIARQLLSALYTCHVDQKLYHRDIKPENIMLNDQTDVVLVDFGLSNHFYNDDDRIRGTQGTTLYFAPEIVRTGIPDKKVYGC